MPVSSIFSPVTAVTAIGTSCRPCSRFCAVTTISSSAIWASVGGATGASAMATASTDLRMLGMMSDPPVSKLLYE